MLAGYLVQPSPTVLQLVRPRSLGFIPYNPLAVSLPTSPPSVPPSLRPPVPPSDAVGQAPDRGLLGAALVACERSAAWRAAARLLGDAARRPRGNDRGQERKPAVRMECLPLIYKVPPPPPKQLPSPNSAGPQHNFNWGGYFIIGRHSLGVIPTHSLSTSKFWWVYIEKSRAPGLH